jgi:hypothetical protein
MQNGQNRKLIYNDLAWIDSLISSPQVVTEEAEIVCYIIKKNSDSKIKSHLRLGCSADYHDFTFKKYFNLTGVDLSDTMLNLVRVFICRKPD